MPTPEVPPYRRRVLIPGVS